MINDTFILSKPGDNLHIRMSWENQICKPVQLLRGQPVHIPASSHSEKSNHSLSVGKKGRINI